MFLFFLLDGGVEERNFLCKSLRKKKTDLESWRLAGEGECDRAAICETSNVNAYQCSKILKRTLSIHAMFQQVLD